MPSCIPDPTIKHQVPNWQRCKNCKNEFYERQQCHVEKTTKPSKLADLPPDLDNFSNADFVERKAGKVQAIQEKYDGDAVDHVYSQKR